MCFQWDCFDFGPAVTVDVAETDVLVTQGRVQVSGVDELVDAGGQIKLSEMGSDPLRDHSSNNHVDLPSMGQTAFRILQLEWTRDLIAAATGPLVAKSEYSGGALVTVDPNGQSSKLSLRNYHIDVHIEDGFARTTIDQTYFNHTHSRLEGTFHFPLPTDASLSRLAMYVNGKLMEGGMAERDHARNTFEEIKRKMLDPALLEWVDGSTFKMRVFPLEPRQEKRIVLSYSQRLPSSDGQLSYRFPAGHTMDAVRDWSTHVVVKGGKGNEWQSQSHTMTATTDGDDLVLDAALKNALLDKDFVLRIHDSVPSPPDLAGCRDRAIFFEWSESRIFENCREAMRVYRWIGIGHTPQRNSLCAKPPWLASYFSFCCFALFGAQCGNQVHQLL